MDKNYKPVYVQGTKTGKGVIEALEEYGGINNFSYAGTDSNCIYFIMPNSNLICITDYESKFGEYITVTAKEVKPLKPLRWRAEENSPYYIINWVLGVKKLCDDREPSDDALYDCGNYFRTEAEAKEMAEKIKKVLLPD